jgi:hypothetical protein
MSQHTDGTRRSGKGTVVAIVLILIAIALIVYFGWWAPNRHHASLLPSVPSQNLTGLHRSRMSAPGQGDDGG